MDPDRKRIIDMLEQGKLSPDQAERLLTALGQEPQHKEVGVAVAIEEPPPKPEQPGPGPSRYLHVLVEKPSGGEKVNICVPLRLLKSGLKLGNLLPERYRESIRKALEKRGYHTGEKGDIWEAIVDKIGDVSVDVVVAEDHVKVYCD
jgi:hypothetical protein